MRQKRSLNPTRLPPRFIPASVTALGLMLPLGNAAYAATGPTRSLDNARQMYQGASMNCLIANDFYALHFTAVQRGRRNTERTEFVKYCQEIPQAGEIFLSVDLLDRDVRQLPVALRVVEETVASDGKTLKETRTLVETRKKVYRNGTAETRVQIDQPGHYALEVAIGEDPFSEDDRVHIPFSVGIAAPTNQGSWLGKATWTMVAIFFGIMGVIGFRTLRTPQRGAAAPREPNASGKLPVA